jgi:plastocyanin
MTRHRVIPRILIPVSALIIGAGAMVSCSTAGGPGGTTTSAHPPVTSSTPAISATGSASTSTGQQPSRSAAITIDNFAYTVPAKVAPGATLAVHNTDNVAHTVTADSAGGFNVSIPPGATASFTAPDHAGSYPFHCVYHANMHGTLTVQ